MDVHLASVEAGQLIAVKNLRISTHHAVQHYNQNLAAAHNLPPFTPIHQDSPSDTIQIIMSHARIHLHVIKVPLHRLVSTTTLTPPLRPRLLPWSPTSLGPRRQHLDQERARFTQHWGLLVWTWHKQWMGVQWVAKRPQVSWPTDQPWIGGPLPDHRPQQRPTPEEEAAPDGE